MKKISGVITALSIAGLTSMGAWAAGDKGGKWSSFKDVDADSNGAISMEEARAVPGLSDHFTKYDKNGDGQLSKSEYEAAKKGAEKGAKGEKGG